MGVTEEVGKVADNITGAMRSQPILLGLLILNLSMIVLLWLVLMRVGDNRTADIRMFYENQKVVQDLLTKCERRMNDGSNVGNGSGSKQQ